MAQPNPLTTPYFKAESYFKRAWRDELAIRRPHWKSATLNKNLAYLWASRTQAEENACQQLVASGSLMLPAVELTMLPDRSVRNVWIPHQRAWQRLGVAAPAAQPPPPPAILTPPPPPPLPPAPPPRSNTTNFAFWPQDSDQEASLPDDITDNSEADNDDETARKLDQLTHPGTLLSHNEQLEASWHGVRELGQGAHGRAILWVRLSESNAIVDRMSIKDTIPATRTEWSLPYSWRDSLPLELAVSQRLASQEHANIHKFRGYRLNMAARRYRLYNDVCDYKDLSNLLFFYCEHSPSKLKARREEERSKGKRKAPEDEEAEDETMPESFLWYIFSELTNALLVLKNGNQRSSPADPWKEIVHKDICLNNIFATPPLREDETVDSDAKGKQWNDEFGDEYYTVGRDKWPHLLLADFDTAFFDLQDGDDTYQDNAFHYCFKPRPDEHEERVDSDGRYPPDNFLNFYVKLCRERKVETDDVFKREDVKMGSATDVWGLGQIMWNLLQNLSQGGDFRPFFDNVDHESFKTKLIDPDLTPYSQQDLDKLFLTGDRPNEVTRLYSMELKDLVRRCVAWDPAERIAIEELKARIDEVRRKEDKSARDVVRLYVPHETQEFAMGKAYEGRKRRRLEGEGEGEGE